MITGAFLAERASVADNKLNVSGGVFTGYRVGPDRKARFVVVVLTRAEAESSARRVEVELKSPSGGGPLKMECELPEATIVGKVGFAFFNVNVGLPYNGEWVFVVTDGLSTFSLPLEVSG